MPISSFQAEVLRCIAAHRNPNSHVAGGIAINRDGPRYSGYIDIFHDSLHHLEAAVVADEAAFTVAGYALTWHPILRTTRREATVARNDGHMQLEWALDSAFRFFPAQPDPLFGYVLHPVDLATNKVAAAADRRVPRDIVDLVTVHERALPLGAIVAAAVGRFPGTSPEGMLAEITRHSRFTAAEFQALATDQPTDVQAMHRRIRAMIEDAERFLAALPSDAVGLVFLDGDTPVQPDPANLACHTTRPGSLGGVWPTVPDVTGPPDHQGR